MDGAPVSRGEPRGVTGDGSAHFTRRAFLGGSLAAGVGVALGACDAGLSGQTQARGSQGAAGAASELISRPFGGNLEQEGTPQQGGTVSMGLDRAPISFDPTAGRSNEAASAVYDSLLKVNQDGAVEPYLAKSITSSDDARVWTLQLRPDVLFHDGTRLDADAVVFNINRHRQMPTSEGHVHAKTIKSVTAVDDLTVRFVLKEPLGQFDNLFALPYSEGSLGMIASPAAVRKYGDSYGRHPVGAGPFEFVKWTQDSIVFRRNDNYWQEGLPYLDQLTVKWLEDTETRYRSVESGTVDLISAAYNTEVVRGLRNPGLNVYYGPGFLGAAILIFNYNEPPFNDRRMREAIVRTINPDAMSHALFQGVMPQARTLFTERGDYYSKKAANLWPMYNRKRAKELIASYKADGGNPNCTFSTTNASNRIQTGQFIQAQCAAVGLDVKLKFYDLSQWASTIVDEKAYQFGTSVIGQGVTEYPGPRRTFHSDGGGNYMGYSNPQLDEVLDRAARTTDGGERAALYKKAQVIINKDMPVVWYTRSFLATITQEYVKGVVRYPERTLFFATLWRGR